MNETKYTSFDLMKIFGIKKGSWYNVKNKFELDQFSEQIYEGKQTKFVHSRMMIRMIHRQPQSLPLFHMFVTSFPFLSNSMMEGGQMRLDHKNFFVRDTCPSLCQRKKGGVHL